MSGPDADRSQAALPAKVGVYVCHCGHNIAGKVDVERVVAFAASLPGVSVARDYKFMCSDPGQELIQRDIRDGLVNRVVVASCSPLMHRATFRRATEASGSSLLLPDGEHPRHVSWVTADRGTRQRRRARSSPARAARCRARAAGPAPRAGAPGRLLRQRDRGVHAALTLADAGKHVYLVEQGAVHGSAAQMAKFDKTFPTLDYAACVLTPKMVQVGQHPNIDLLSFGEVEQVSGYVGNFRFKCAGRTATSTRTPVPAASLRRELPLGRDPVEFPTTASAPALSPTVVPAGRPSLSCHRPRGTSRCRPAPRPASKPTATCR